ncbi:putative short-chain dehydrogenase [Exophiala viscosa]|uniref:Short-chain dehydrogenase n=1 Tax=Exophiala viscosa TaxID=2486360 RepID=A0AAN6IHR1_9EURO|nr:putative short-chain dehydrogenase [Exophiala viscosa]KAI1627167.1 putative short-chain dehydrogenase [Exophiala viscosa]
MTGANETSTTNGNTNGHTTMPTTESPRPLNLTGKTAIVTGSARGIGAGIALELGSRGANIVVNFTSESSRSNAEKIVSKIESLATGAKAVTVHASVVDKVGQQALIDAALKLGSGHIDILVHNAGNGDDRYLTDITEEFYDMQMDINLKAPIFLTQLALPHIPRGGRVIIVSSVSARMGVPQQTVYAASKAATEALARVWATELGQSRGITVNCVNPGPVATDMYYASDQSFIDALKPMIDSTPAEARIGEVRDIAPLVGFLASEESRWVTGSVVSASGGLLFF